MTLEELWWSIRDIVKTVEPSNLDSDDIEVYTSNGIGIEKIELKDNKVIITGFEII